MESGVLILIRMLQYALEEKRKLVSHLSAAQLAVTPANFSNNAGMLLMHLCYMERYVEVISINGMFEYGETAAWKGARSKEIMPGAVWPYDAAYYLDLSERWLQRVTRALAMKDEKWLHKYTMGRLQPERTQFGIWTHLLEEEFGHTYQIRMILKKI